MSKEKITAIIVAGGAGKRLDSPVSTPKGFVPLSGKPLFLHSLEIFIAHELVNDVVLVVPEGFESFAGIINKELKFTKPITIVTGGKVRWQSVQKGVAATMADWVLVHDAARPFVTRAVIDAVLEKRTVFDCVITATPEVDTLRMLDGDFAGEVVDRSKIVRVGTPQLFRRAKLFDAFMRAPALAEPPTDEAMLMQLCGIAPGIACGDPLNFKITTPADLVIAEAICEKREAI